MKIDLTQAPVRCLRCHVSFLPNSGAVSESPSFLRRPSTSKQPVGDLPKRGYASNRPHPTGPLVSLQATIGASRAKATFDDRPIQSLPGNLKSLLVLLEPRKQFLADEFQALFVAVVLKSQIEHQVFYVSREELFDLRSAVIRVPYDQPKKVAREKSVESIEKSFVLAALRRNSWNVTRSAEETGMQRPNFQALMKKHGIRVKGTEQESDGSVDA